MKKYLLRVTFGTGGYKEYETSSFFVRADEDGRMWVQIDDAYSFGCIQLEIKVRETV